MVETLKKRMGREPVFGTFAFLPCANTVEIIGQSGFDFVIIDQEHSPKDWSVTENMVRAAQLTGMAAMIRTRDADEKSILEALELGVEGIVVPFVSTDKDSMAIARSSKYPPEGNRGTCTMTRAARYGALRGEKFLEHCRKCNEDVLIVAQLEDASAVEHAEAMANLELGADVLVVGRADLASSLGVPGQVNDPLVEAATKRILTAVKNSPIVGRHSGMGVYTPEEAEKWMQFGTRFFIYAADVMLFRNAATQVADAFIEWRSSKK
jgi:4-hydroxy-2-oxoheptanedioate aldolase